MYINHRELLKSLGLTPEALAARRGAIGGSDSRIIMSGNADRIVRLWGEKRGEVEPEDLSDQLNVMLGLFTEPFNAAWFEKVTGREIGHRQKLVESPVFPFMRATLDGMTLDDEMARAVWEAKHVNAFMKNEEIAQIYMPQVHHQMHCSQTDRAFLSVIKGTTDLLIFTIRRDDWYLAQLIEAERDFWDAVTSGRMPAVAQHVPATEAIEAVRTIDMTGSNSWATAAATWIETRPAALLFERTVDDIKAMLEPEVRVAFGHGIRATRAKNGSVRITRDQNETTGKEAA